MHHFVGADSSCISWGHAQYGELGYGPSGQKYVISHFMVLFVFEVTFSVLNLGVFCFGILGLLQYPKK